jgi:hypothetical protein
MKKIKLLIQLIVCIIVREICWTLESIHDFFYKDKDKFYPSNDWESRCHILSYSLKLIQRKEQRRRNALKKKINKGIEKYNRRMDYQRRKLEKIEGIDFEESLKRHGYKVGRKKGGKE